MKIKTALPKSPCSGRLDFCPRILSHLLLPFWCILFPTGDDHYLCYLWSYSSGDTHTYLYSSNHPSSHLTLIELLIKCPILQTETCVSAEHHSILTHWTGLFQGAPLGASPAVLSVTILWTNMRTRDSFLTLVMDSLLCGYSLTFHAKHAQNWVETFMVLEELNLHLLLFSAQSSVSVITSRNYSSQTKTGMLGWVNGSFCCREKSYIILGQAISFVWIYAYG